MQLVSNLLDQSFNSCGAHRSVHRRANATGLRRRHVDLERRFSGGYLARFQSVDPICDRLPKVIRPV